MRSSAISSCCTTASDDFLFGLVEELGSLGIIWKEDVDQRGEDTCCHPFEEEDPNLVSGSAFFVAGGSGESSRKRQRETKRDDDGKGGEREA